MVYNVGSLFAGVGGICLGFKKAYYNDDSYELKWANEIDPYACETYRHNFKHKLLKGDIEKIVNPSREEDEDKRNEYKKMLQYILSEKIDVLTAGFPCQAFSIAGERKGFDDHRGNLFWSIIDLIKELEVVDSKPRVLLLENVKNLHGHDGGKTYKVIKDQLLSLGYHVKERVLNTKDYTRLPQNRERIYIVCFLSRDDYNRFTLFDNDKLKSHKISKTNEERISDIKKVLDLNKTYNELSKYYYNKDKFPNYFMSEEEFNISGGADSEKNRINLEESITEFYEFYQIRRSMYVRKNQNGVCPTLTANMGTGGHNVALIKVQDGIRKLTPEETFKLQGFPIGSEYFLPEKYLGRDYSDGRLYKQAGNAVSVDMIELIATEILKAMH